MLKMQVPYILSTCNAPHLQDTQKMSPHIDVGCTSTWDTCRHSTVQARSRLSAISNAQKAADGRALRAEKDLAPLGMKGWLQPQQQRCPTARRMQQRLLRSLFSVRSGGAKRTTCARSMHQKLRRLPLIGTKDGARAGSVVGARTKRRFCRSVAA